MVVVMAVIRVAVTVSKNLSICMLCNGIVWVVVLVLIVVVVSVGSNSHMGGEL